MMQAIRDRAQSWIAWIIVLFLIIVFALWGVQGYVGSTANDDVADVNGLGISKQDFEAQYRNYRDQYRQQLLQAVGNNVDHPLFKQLFNEQVMRQRVLDGMIQGRLVTLAAIDAGFNIGDEQINDIILQVPAFQKDGQFDSETYKYKLRVEGMTNKSFKSRVRQDEMSGQFMSGLRDTAFATPLQVDNWIKLQNQQRSFRYLTLKAESHRHEASINDDMIKSYYDNNTAQFMTEEHVSLEYLELSSAGLAEKAVADEQVLRDYYEERKTDYAVVDTTSQVATLNDIRKRAMAGEDFAVLAKEFSQDALSAAAGGEIGTISRLDMEPLFSEAAFALQQGEISEPVQTSFGMHLIRVNSIDGEQRNVSHILLEVDKKKLRTRNFEEVREQVEKDYHAANTEKRFGELFQLLNNLTYEQPDTLIPAAEELGLEIKTTETFTRRGGTGLSANPAVVKAAFSEDVLAGNNSEAIELGKDHVVVVRVKSYQPAAPKPLEEVNDAIIQRLLDQESRKRVMAHGQELLQRLGSGETLADIAKAENVELPDSQLVMRSASKQPRELVDALFAMPRPAGDSPVYKGVELVSGDYALVALEGVTDGDPAAVSKEQRLAAARAMTGNNAERDFTAMKTDLRQSADITIYEDDKEEEQ